MNDNIEIKYDENTGMPYVYINGKLQEGVEEQLHRIIGKLVNKSFELGRRQGYQQGYRAGQSVARDSSDWWDNGQPGNPSRSDWE